MPQLIAMTDREKAHQIAALYKKAKSEKKVPSYPTALSLTPFVSISTSVHVIRYCNSSHADSERSNTSWLNVLITANEFLIEKVRFCSIFNGISTREILHTYKRPLNSVNCFQAAARSATSILDKRRRSALRSAWRRNSRGNIRQENAGCLCGHYLNFDEIEVTVTCPNPEQKSVEPTLICVAMLLLFVVAMPA